MRIFILQSNTKGVGTMDIKKLLISFVTAFALTLVVSAIVNYIWEGAINWETSFRLATILGIVLSWMDASESRGN